ncbi:MAG: PhoH family protein [Actinomycetaceae bacterium]|nr:PhoH family protein [Actinomycetaceae bacterium]MDY5854963.1 PhoH family protein [Arcanobacterium sp.]
MLDIVSVDEVQHTIEVPAAVAMVNLLGYEDSVLRALERALPQVAIHVRHHTITLTGARAEVDFARELFSELIAVVAAGEMLSAEAATRAAAIARSGLARPTDLLATNILSTRGKTIRPKSLGQKSYVDAIDSHEIVFGIGPAGTGKTYLAMAKAVVALHEQRVRRIILTRPAVEAGESLGFLPGTLTDKIDPYVRPLYDALHDMVDPDAIGQLIAAGTIEVAPLAYMRGRTLNDAFIILDEAQNTTPEQMKMFLTRLGFGSKMVVTGDVTQIDLPGRVPSGLLLVREILRDVDGVQFIELSSADVVRHRLVADIIDAYARWDEDSALGRR